jgi:hypothetical protein
MATEGRRRTRTPKGSAPLGDDGLDLLAGATPAKRRLLLAEGAAHLARARVQELEQALAEARLAFHDPAHTGTNVRANAAAKALGLIEPDGKAQARLPHDRAARAYVQLRRGKERLLVHELRLAARKTDPQGWKGSAADLLALAPAELASCEVVYVSDIPAPDVALRLVAKWYGYASAESCLRQLQTVRKRWEASLAKADPGRSAYLRGLVDGLDDLPDVRTESLKRQRPQREKP